MKLFTTLCCINPSCPIDDIDEYTFYQLVNPIAPVINIKIFDRCPQIKAFVQVKTREQIDEVINQLHGKHLSIGKIKVFTSTKKFIAYDRSVPQIVAEAQWASYHGKKPIEVFKLKMEENFNPSNNNLTRGFKPKSGSSSPIQKVELEEDKEYDSDKGLISKWGIYKVNDQIIISKNDIKEKNDSDLSFDTIKNADRLLAIQQNSQYAQAQYIIKVSNFNLKKISHQALFNLFSCFGNVPKLLIQEEYDFAILQYENKKQVQQAIKFTDCIRFFGNVLHVEQYNGPDLFNPSPFKGLKSSKLYNYKNANYRFVPQESEAVNLPSRTLLIYGMSRFITIEAFKEFISSVFQPIRVVPKPDNNNTKQTFLVEYKFLYESIRVLCTLHNTCLGGDTLYVSFFRKSE